MGFAAGFLKEKGLMRRTIGVECVIIFYLKPLASKGATCHV